MKYGVLSVAAALALGACGGRKGNLPQSPDTSMANMPGMPGVVASSGGDSSAVAIDRAAAGRVGITFARATMGAISGSVRLAGTLVYPEPTRRVVTARVSGWVEHLNADYVGKPVRAGDSLLVLYAPDLVGAEEEYLSARHLGDSALTYAARQRLALWQLPAEVLAALDRTGTSVRTFVIQSPSAGEIVEKTVVEGQAVHPGDPLFLIADRATMWVDAIVHEMDASSVRVGLPVTVSVNTVPGRTWRGTVIFIQPAADSLTRTLTARIEVANADGQLRPGMYATVDVGSTGVRALTVPLTAVLPTGRHNLVFVNRGDGRFVPRDVQVGARDDSLIEVTSGLKAGDEVVASATYLVDSETNLAAAMRGLMLQMGMGLDMGGMKRPTKDSAP